MNREEFNQLDIKGQVDYFNEELKQENNNFNAICRSLGISKNTILNRFKTNGFEPLRVGQKIIGFSPHMGNEENSQQVENNLTVENSSLINLNSEKLPLKNKGKVSNPEYINLILNRIDLLEQKVEEHSSILSNTKEGQNAILRYDKNFINSYENTTTKTFKIDVEVYQELEKLFDKYKMYKRQDIVSSLLKYALDNIE